MNDDSENTPNTPQVPNAAGYGTPAGGPPPAPQTPEPPLELQQSPPKPHMQFSHAPAVQTAPTPAAPPATPKKAEEKTKEKSIFGHSRDFVVELAKIVMIVLLLRAYVIQASSVEGHSMDNTLHDGDLLLVERFTMSLVNSPEWLKAVVPTGWLPELKRGDIVVLTSPEDGNNELVKRVIAIEGDFIFFYKSKVWVNGEALEESYLSQEILDQLGRNKDGDYKHFDYSDVSNMPQRFLVKDSDFEEAVAEDSLITTGVEVPAGCVFVMGDNRTGNASNDSRAWSSVDLSNSPGETGMMWVAMRNVHGRVLARLMLPWEYNDDSPLFPR